jgi:glucose/mannose transport system substrate-binding protein
MKINAFKLFGLILVGLLHLVPSFAGEAEVLHFWTSPGEAKSVDELKALMAQRGHVWKDFAVVGGGGQNAMAALKERVVSGRPPAAASIKGPAIQEWAKLNYFTNLDLMASVEKWDQVLPKVVQDQVKYKGSYIAVPVNVHRANWMWTNTEVLAKSGVEKNPTTFDEFFIAAEKIKAKGYIPLAHGGQAWQNFVLFETVVLGVGGIDLYRRALIELDAAALTSPAMQKSLDVFRRLRGYTDEKSLGRDWNATTDLVIKAKAAFQFMGDWAKGEFLVAGQQPGKEFLCSATPGSSNAFIYIIDAFPMFQLKSWEAQKAQGYLAYVMLGAKFQESFNLRKGSIPARNDVQLDQFDNCAKTSKRDMEVTSKTGGLLPSVAVDMALPTKTHAAIREVINDYWSNDQVTANQAITRFISASTVK